MNKVTQLAKRLQELIAMAESQNRSGARQQVRMAEDSNAAKAEGQSAPTSAESGRDASADIDTLTRQVTEQVTHELGVRRERRQEIRMAEASGGSGVNKAVFAEAEGGASKSFTVQYNPKDFDRQEGVLEGARRPRSGRLAGVSEATPATMSLKPSSTRPRQV